MNEIRTFQDPFTACSITQWTAHPSNHPYFTNPGWYDSRRRLAFASDKAGRSRLASLSLQTGEQQVLFEAPNNESLVPFHIAVDAASGRILVHKRRRLTLVDGFSGSSETLHELRPGWEIVMPNFTADGSRVTFGETESSELGFDAHFSSKPTTRIFCLDLQTRNLRVLHERDRWMGHINPSPSSPTLLSFCHEGPWTQLEHRIWGLNIEDGQHWKAGPELRAPACVGHEYWLADGKRIAYHGFDEAANPILGILNVHSDDHRRYSQPIKTKHSHSLDGHLIVGDGSEALPWILVWKLEDDVLSGPWRICEHGGAWSEQRRHIHPRIAPDGKTVLFTSDKEGEPRLYSVTLPDSFDDAWLVT